MDKLVLSKTNIYMIIYGIIFLLFIVAFASQPYLTVSNDILNINYYYTNVITTFNGEKYKDMTIQDSSNDLYVILILSIIIFICFGCSFLTLFLNAKKLNKFFNILILLAMIIIIIIFHVSIYDNNSKIRNLINSVLPYFGLDISQINIKTTETAGYALTMTCTVLMFVTVVSSFIY